MSYNKLRENLPAINARLSKVFDGNDPIRMGLGYHGFQRSGGKRGGSRYPGWAPTNEGIRKVIQLAFPKFKTDERQRLMAARWARIIYLYYRAGHTYSQIAEEMNIHSPSAKRPYRAVERLIEHIENVAKGRSSHSERGPRKQRGRPRKIRGVTPASNGDVNNEPRSDRQGTLLLPPASRGAAGPRKV